MDSQQAPKRSETKQQARERVQRELAELYPCHVLITADGPSPAGQMQVELSYEGDPILAAYLLEGAQSYFEEEDVDEETFPIGQ